jgi:hypothetical protein
LRIFRNPVLIIFERDNLFFPECLKLLEQIDSPSRITNHLIACRLVRERVYIDQVVQLLNTNITHSVPAQLTIITNQLNHSSISTYSQLSFLQLPSSSGRLPSMHTSQPYESHIPHL